MSKDSRVTRLKNTYEQFVSTRPRDLEGARQFQDYDGANLEETKKSISYIFSVFDGLASNETWDELSWHAANSLESQLQACISSYNQLLNSPTDQSTFQNYAQQIDALAYHLRGFGVHALAMGTVSLERLSANMNNEMENLARIRAEAEKLREEVRALITPAVAGSLSQAFTARKKTLFAGRLFWGGAALVIGGYCIYSTYEFATMVGKLTLLNSAATAVASAVKQEMVRADMVMPTILIRSVILIPLYAAFGFSFSQYKKERDFEEEYAHKAAVATSLPNYGDLTREPAVRDQIVTGATNVIFSSPTSKYTESEKQEKTLGGLKEIIDSLSKFIPKKD